MELFKQDTYPRLTWEDVFTPAQGEPGALNAIPEGQTLISPTIIGGIMQGASYRSADSGARFEIFPEEDPTIGIVNYNAAGTSVFKTLVGGTNTGDVVMGDYAGGAGAMWDQSGSSFDVLGSITATSGAIGGWTITTGYLYSLASGTPTSSPSDGIVLASGNEAMIVYENTQKRVEVGYLSAGVYGLKGYADDGSTVVIELSDTQKKIAGWHFTDTTLANHATAASANVLIDSANSLIRLGPTAGTYISVDGANQKIESSDYSPGSAGAGFHLSAALLETGNAAIRGIIRTAVFQKDVISAVGGNVAILDADVLATTMTALDADTLTIEGNTTFAVNDILRIKDGTDDEWFTVTNIGSAPTYTVTRDGGTDYAADSNPTWGKGATVVNYGASGDGGIYMTASESNAPYLSVFTHAGSPWDTITTRLRIGNLNGYLGYGTDLYGIGIGETGNSMTYDPTNGLRITGTITGGTIQTSASGARTVIAGATDNITVYDASNNVLFDVNTSGQPILRAILFDNSLDAFLVANDSSIIVGASSIIKFEIRNASSTAPTLELGNAGTGAHLQLTGDPDGSNTVDGDVWFDGTDLKLNVAATKHILCKAGANETITGTWGFSAFPTTPSSLPTTDYQVANKLYADDGPAYTAGDELNYIDDEREQTNAAAYTKLKSITIRKGGTLRIKFDQACVDGGADESAAKIYRNGEAVGTEQESSSIYPTWTNKSEDIAGWSAGDTLELWGHKATDSWCHVRALRVYAAEADKIKTDEPFDTIKYVEIAPISWTSTSGVNAWEDWDLSAVIPAGAKYVEVQIWSDDAQYLFGLRENGATVERQTSNQTGHYYTYTLNCKLDSNLVVERYAGTTAAKTKFAPTGYWI